MPQHNCYFIRVHTAWRSRPGQNPTTLACGSQGWCCTFDQPCPGRQARYRVKGLRANCALSKQSAAHRYAGMLFRAHTVPIRPDVQQAEAGTTHLLLFALLQLLHPDLQAIRALFSNSSLGQLSGGQPCGPHGKRLTCFWVLGVLLNCVSPPPNPTMPVSAQIAL